MPAPRIPRTIARAEPEPNLCRRLQHLAFVRQLPCVACGKAAPSLAYRNRWRSSGAAAIVAAAASSPDAAEAAQALDGLPATRPARQATDVVSGRVGGAQQNGSPLSNLLQAQANMMQNSIANAGPADGSDPPLSAVASPRSIPQSSPSLVGGAQASLAAMTHTAQANVQMLVKALNAVCIGASCAQ